MTPHVIVIDDGSWDDTAGALSGLTVTLIRHGATRGKGASLVSGFAAAIDLDVDAVITVDGDGQHRIEEIPNFLSHAQAHPGHIITGNRLHEPDAIPRARYTANRIANFWISWACGQWLADSQCGFRLYPKEILEAVSPECNTDRSFVFESEFMIEAADLGYRFSSVPIAPIYSNSSRQSHFRPVPDITRIVLMVAGRLLAHCMRPGKLYAALISRTP